MMGIERYVRVLRLFTTERGSWTIAEIAESLDASVSTLYRLVRELVATGFLESTVDARFRLGPAFVEYERRIRLTDPLIRSGSVFLQPMVDHIGAPCTALLARLYGDTVMCVADARSPAMTIKTSYERGLPMPMTRGATSLAILASLNTRRLTRVFDAIGLTAADEAARLTESLTAIRRAGHAISFGQVDTGAVGIAVAIKNRDLGIDASLSVVMAASDLSDDLRRRIIALLITNARMIETFMRESQQSTDTA